MTKAKPTRRLDIPNGLEEALKRGFTIEGSSDTETSEDYREEWGTYEVEHPDGTALIVPYRAMLTFGKPELDRKITRANKGNYIHDSLTQK